MSDDTRTHGGGPRTEHGRRMALANLRQFRDPKHGAHAVRGTDGEVVRSREEITAMVVAEIGDRLRPADRTTVSLLAIAIRRIGLLENWLDSKGMVEKDGQVKPAMGVLVQLLKVAREYAGDLGMSPQGRAKMGLTDRPKSALQELADAYAAAERAEKEEEKN